MTELESDFRAFLEKHKVSGVSEEKVMGVWYYRFDGVEHHLIKQ